MMDKYLTYDSDSLNFSEIYLNKWTKVVNKPIN